MKFAKLTTTALIAFTTFVSPVKADNIDFSTDPAVSDQVAIVSEPTPCYSKLAQTVGSIEYGECVPVTIMPLPSERSTPFGILMMEGIEAAMPYDPETMMGCVTGDYDTAMSKFEQAFMIAEDNSYHAMEAQRGYVAAYAMKHKADEAPQESYRFWVNMTGIRSTCD